MPSVYPHSIPTPPFSPNPISSPLPDSQNPLKATIHLLDSLVAFYQHERMWVYRARAVLEEAFDEPLPALTPPTSNLDDVQMGDNQLPSPPESSASSSSSETSSSVQKNQSEPADSDHHVPPRKGHKSSRWTRRKRDFNLRIEGIAPKPRRIKTGHKQSQGQEAKEHILKLFENLMEDRMESCQRVNKLVRNANLTYQPPR